jgi:molecular chaperone GrpE
MTGDGTARKRRAARRAEDVAEGEAGDQAAGTPVPRKGPPPEAGTDEAAAKPEAPEEDAGLLRDRWLRAEAELQNYRRRAAREREEARRGAEEAALLEIITALDDLDRAVTAAQESGAPPSWSEGVRLVMNRLVEALARRGVVMIDPLGKPFDPAFQEAILETEAPGIEAGCVAQVILKGWRRGDRALRAARVVVARAPTGSE